MFANFLKKGAPFNLKQNMKKIVLVNTLAAQIRKHTGANRSVSMKQAWQIIKSTPSAQLLKFRKKGEDKITVRVVSSRWFDYSQPKGGTSKPTLTVFADLSKVAVGTYPIISAITQNIIN